MDWGAVTPNLIIGVVGVAGIAGAIASARIARRSAAENIQTNIQAEDQRDMIAAKRRIYADFLDLITLATTQISDTDTSDRTALLAKASSKVWEIRLIASSDIYRAALKSLSYLTSAPSLDIDAFGERFNRLAELMRRDLESLSSTARQD